MCGLRQSQEEVGNAVILARSRTTSQSCDTACEVKATTRAKCRLYRLLIYGVVLVVMMLLRPEGLLPSRTRRAELHERFDDDEVIYEEEAGERTGRPVVTG